MGCSPSTPADNNSGGSEGNEDQDSCGRINKQGDPLSKLKGDKRSTGSSFPVSGRGSSNTNILLNSSSSIPRFRMIDQQRYLEKPEVISRNGRSQVKLGPMSIVRTTPVRVALAFPKEDSLFNGICGGCDRLGWSCVGRVNNIQEQIVYLTRDPCSIDLLLVDYRNGKLLPQNVLSSIRSMKEENSTLVVVAFVKKNSLDKCESAVTSMPEYGIDWVETDFGQTSGTYWQHQLSQYERSFCIPALKMASAKALLVALDHCKDMIQVTDSSHRIQFVNRAYEKLMGYSCEEISGCDFHELQTTRPESEQRHDSSPTTALNTVLQAGRVSPNQAGSALQQGQPPPPPFHDHLLTDLSQGKDWEGNYMYNPKIGDPVFLNSKVLPFNANMNLLHNLNQNQNANFVLPPGGGEGTKPKVNLNSPSSPSSTHFIYVSDVPSSFADKSCSSEVGSNQDVGGYPMPRGSLKSLRKASYDIKSISNDSSILRRQSLAKLHSLTIEAPITKVINIIAAAQQSCPLYIATALEKVLEILRTTELYSPQFFEGSYNKIKSDDPLTTDLLGALLSSGPRLSTTGRRSSNENTASRLAPRPSLPDIAEAPTCLQKLLESEERWSFDVILLEEITEKRPLVWLGMTIFTRFGVAQVLQTDEATLRNWLTLIEANYHSANSYHNSTHAADVLQATAYFLSTDRLKGFLEPLDEIVSLMAAVVHDVDHPGKTSPFLINSGNDLALLYNDLSVLESHHAAFTFKLTLSDPRVNIFQSLDQESYKIFRQSLIDMVLATEMNKHFEHLSKFVNVFTKPFLKEEHRDSGPVPGPSDRTPVTPTEPDISTLMTPENVVLIKRMLIKCADVGNPTRPLKLCIEWAKRIAEEYFRQTEDELLRGLPPVMPMFERSACSIPKSQTGFVDYFVADMYEAWDAFLDVPEVLDHMKYNYEYWKEVDRLGIKDAVYLEEYVAKYPPPTARWLTCSEQSQL